VLTDFGLACPAEFSLADDPASLAGTPDYMAPEQLNRQALTFATDVFALGVVIYEMVTGAKPFSSSSTLTGAARRADSAPVHPRVHLPALDAGWENVILRCLRRDPSERFSRAGDVVQGAGAGIGCTAAPRP
jgi:serine/threonine-protein kinase